ncbi:hypothetical protein AAFC00_004130 [Neodothiora populina]|uniref:Ribosomal protein bL31m N-terminal domain-containing protein n=1 Tax=Neodothiora populina TaxID=2781224 RepID=A0ABR3PIN9_9PEZI
MLSQTTRRTSSTAQFSTTITHQQTRHASLLRRPKRPYTFTQLVTLSDGSTFTQRTTSPMPIYRSTKDVRNSALWNPSSQKLLNIEEDEAGRLKRFRGRFGRGWDAETVVGAEEARDGEEALDPSVQEESLLDLIANYGQEAIADGGAAGSNDEAKRSGKGKGGEK